MGMTLSLTKFAIQSKDLSSFFSYLLSPGSRNLPGTNICRLSEIISKHSARKPIIIFCCTRNSAITTSKNLAKLWHSLNAPSRMWKGPTKNIAVQNVDLRGK